MTKAPVNGAPWRRRRRHAGGSTSPPDLAWKASQNIVSRPPSRIRRNPQRVEHSCHRDAAWSVDTLVAALPHEEHWLPCLFLA